MKDKLNRTVSIAPMMDWTDRHECYFLRLISPHALLYTEMITAAAIVYGDHQNLLRFHSAVSPIALQLGGSDPALLSSAVNIAQAYPFSEINLNVGCPSDRVQSGRFGACLMAEPELVAACVSAMRAVTTLPVTVKTRIGIDNRDSYEELCHFIETVAATGCDVFVIHARKAWLKGLSPKENREVPPLKYEVVKQLKKDFPELTIIVNGGVQTPVQVLEHLAYADGVMIGRAAYQNPYILAELERVCFDNAHVRTRQQVIHDLMSYIQAHLAEGGRLIHITRHILGLFQGQPGAKKWRRYLSQHAHQPDANIAILEEALAIVLEFSE